MKISFWLIILKVVFLISFVYMFFDSSVPFQKNRDESLSFQVLIYSSPSNTISNSSNTLPSTINSSNKSSSSSDSHIDGDAPSKPVLSYSKVPEGPE